MLFVQIATSKDRNVSFILKVLMVGFTLYVLHLLVILMSQSVPK